MGVFFKLLSIAKYCTSIDISVYNNSWKRVLDFYILKIKDLNIGIEYRITDDASCNTTTISMSFIDIE